MIVERKFRGCMLPLGMGIGRCYRLVVRLMASQAAQSTDLAYRNEDKELKWNLQHR